LNKTSGSLAKTTWHISTYRIHPSHVIPDSGDFAVVGRICQFGRAFADFAANPRACRVFCFVLIIIMLAISSSNYLLHYH
jgi:hypothetical protein